MTLIMSAGSKSDLERMINAYFFSSGYRITDDLQLVNEKKPEVASMYKVVKKGKRYRLERNAG